MARYWVGVVSKEHVERGKIGGFAQLCHGKKSPLARLSAGDYLIYYSPKVKMDDGIPYQSFTAVGLVEDRTIYQVEVTSDFLANRRKIKYFSSVDVPIRPLLPDLDFVKNKKNWGSVFRFGLMEISKIDFYKIAQAMKVQIDD